MFWKVAAKAGTEEILLTKTGTVITPSLATKILRNHNKKSGLIGDTRSRNLRCTAATYANDKNIDEGLMAKKMDHSVQTHRIAYMYSMKDRRDNMKLNQALRAMTNER